MKFKSVKEMKNKLYKRTLLDEIKYYLYYAPMNYLDMLPRRIYWFFQRGFRGYGDNDTWDFDCYLCDVILGGLKQLKKYQHGCPTEIYDKYKNRKDLTQKQKDKLTVKEWHTCMDIMIRGFEIGREIIQGGYLDSKKLEDKIYEFDRGMDYFKKYYFSLWD